MNFIILIGSELITRSLVFLQKKNLFSLIEKQELIDDLTQPHKSMNTQYTSTN